MERTHRDILRSNRVLLVKNVIIDEELLSHLLSKKILTDDMKERVECNRTRAQKVGGLLDILPRRGKNAFGEFIKALVYTTQEHLAEELDDPMTQRHVRVRDGEEEEQMEVDSAFPRARDDETINKSIDNIKNNRDLVVDISPMSSEDIDKYRRFLVNEDVYKVTGTARGRAVIMSFHFFTKGELTAREGNEQDVANLEKLLISLNFDVTKLEDQTDEQVKEFLDQESKHTGHKSADMFLMFVMSHGVDGHVYALNGREISIQTIISYFEVKNCPALKGKPKLFFVQACQPVKKETTGHPVQATDSPDGGAAGDAVPGVPVEKLKTVVDRAADKADILLSRATVTGYLAQRDIDFGTLYIRCLIYVFSHFAHTEHVLDMLSKVSYYMSRLKSDHKADDGDIQLPEKRDTFNKKVFFMPGYSGS